MPLLQETEPQIVSRLWDVLSTMRGLITPALAAAGVTDPIEVLVGYPTWSEGAKVWAQPVDPGFVTIDALPDVRVDTRYRPEWGVVAPVLSGFTAAFTATTATFTATANPPAGTNIHAFVRANGNLYDAHYTALSIDTVTTLAAAVATSINALAVGGVSATSSGAITTLSGAQFVTINVGGLGPAHKEVARVIRTVQVSIWVTSPWARYQIQDAIVSTLGAIDNCWLTLPDSGRALCQLYGERFVEESQASYNLYEAHLSYRVNYAVIQRANAYQIGAIEAEISSQFNTDNVLIY